MAEKLLDVKNLSISFGGIKAVEDVTFHVDEQEIVSLIGPNGAGKTTVFNLLTGVYQVDQGTISYKNKEIQNWTPQNIVKEGISRTFQNIRLFGNMRVLENVLVGRHIRTEYSLFDSIFRNRAFKKEEDQNIAEALKVLETLGLYDKKDEYSTNLPYGDQRKLEIARAIATGAELLLLDEPAAGMNSRESESLMRFIGQLRQLGYTILLIEHDMSVVMNISDRIYVLDNGKLIAEGSPKDVAHNPLVIEAYLGGNQNAQN